MLQDLALVAAVVFLIVAADALKQVLLAQPLLLLAAFVVACFAMTRIWPGFVPTDDSLRRK